MLHIFRFKLNTSVAWSHADIIIVDANQRMWKHSPKEVWLCLLLELFVMPWDITAICKCIQQLAHRHGVGVRVPPLLEFLSLVDWLMQRSAHISCICMLSEISIRIEGLKVGSTRKFNKTWVNISNSNFLIYWSFKEKKKCQSNTQELYTETFSVFISSNLEWPSSFLCLHL